MNQNSSGFFSSIPVVTKNLLIINIIIWLAQFILAQKGFDLTQYLGLHYVASDNFQIWQLFTYMFLHSPTDFTHVFFNMFAVFMFGRTLEHVWGGKRFLTYYLITGIGAGLVQILVTYFRIQFIESSLSPEFISEVYRDGATLLKSGKNYIDEGAGSLNLLLNVSTVGASGAVFGILLGFGMLFPNVELMMIPIPMPIKAKYFVVLYGLLELYLGVANRTGDNVAHFAHLGGLLFGLILILYWKKKNKIDVKLY
ncbi:membrane associated rhomboid family serine protease [Dysgonomonas sp. PH5-45]|uniref:rhomboid family intramembrane serine protease n=1 Tax=unclassified Dysgonomonas TaxID=2630389 RepID=UPI0024770125|nr:MULTISPECIES: rhomboid family intramembrane serine protease [unclassified Dysgonomonas]MDH6353789.1 membrane associated rhomboid family serine protease [Dysgonomonas sp. PH5-45]MDH6386691.1 membrane associated rhomboid family serine protease [Dysgonomonas sp. PH5-37]